MDCNQHDDRRTERDQDVSDLLVRQRPGRKVVLRFIGRGGKSRQFLVAQRGNSFLDLDRVEMSGFQGLFSLLGREKLLDFIDILLPRAGSREGRLLKFRRRNYMVLGSQQ